MARVFDAVKLTATPNDAAQVDVWFSQPVLVNRVGANSADHEDNFYGIYGSLKPIRNHTLDTFLFIRNDLDNELAGEIAGHRGRLKEYTVGNRFRGKYSALDYATIRAARANASTTLGQEIDLLAKWQVSKHIDTLLGYSHFDAGAFVKDTGADDNANFFYWQTVVKF